MPVRTFCGSYILRGHFGYIYITKRRDVEKKDSVDTSHDVYPSI